MAKYLINSDDIEIEEVTGTDNLKLNIIYDSGSNSNGNWIKYSDGTMICWDRKIVYDQAIDTSYGNAFQGTRNITYPVNFISQPSAQCSCFHWGTSASWGSVLSTTTSTLTVRGCDFFSRAIGTSCEISWIAIGKWK